MWFPELLEVETITCLEFADLIFPSPVQSQRVVPETVISYAKLLPQVREIPNVAWIGDGGFQVDFPGIGNLQEISRIDPDSSMPHVILLNAIMVSKLAQSIEYPTQE